MRLWYRMLLLGTLSTVASGCGANLGAWIYTLGLVPDEKVSAEFTLPSGPLVVLVDDDMGLINPPHARDALVDALATQLKEHAEINNVTTNEELAHLRQASPDFDKMSIREVGRGVNADTVVWMKVEDFFIEEDLELTVNPGRFSVRLKVFDATAENKQDIRLWPQEREGRIVTLEISPHEIRKCSNRSEVHELMADQMADKIAKLFYDYVIER